MNVNGSWVFEDGLWPELLDDAVVAGQGGAPPARVWLVQHELDRQIVDRLGFLEEVDLGGVDHLVLVVAHGVERVDDVLGGERRAVVPLDALAQFYGDLGEIRVVLPVLGEPVLVFAGEHVEHDQRLGHGLEGAALPAADSPARRANVEVGEVGVLAVVAVCMAMNVWLRGTAFSAPPAAADAGAVVGASSPAGAAGAVVAAGLAAAGAAVGAAAAGAVVGAAAGGAGRRRGWRGGAAHSECMRPARPGQHPARSTRRTGQQTAATQTQPGKVGRIVPCDPLPSGRATPRARSSVSNPRRPSFDQLFDHSMGHRNWLSTRARAAQRLTRFPVSV